MSRQAHDRESYRWWTKKRCKQALRYEAPQGEVTRNCFSILVRHSAEWEKRPRRGRHGQAALSGSKPKAPGSAGGYLLSEALEPPVPPNEGCEKLLLLGAGFGHHQTSLVGSSTHPTVATVPNAAANDACKDTNCRPAIYQPYHDRRFLESSRTGGSNFAEKGLKVPTVGLRRSP